jgi:hypothetical protein
MKNLLLVTMLTFGLFATSFSQGKKTTVPADVQTAFNAMFPTVEKVKWCMATEGEWGADFKINNKKMSASFSDDGTWLRTETTIKASAMPQEVKLAIADEFAGFKMEEVATVERADKPLVYEVDLKKGATYVEVMFDADGKRIRRRAVPVGIGNQEN